MHYTALGDSISIDAYTGVAGGGAASQLARLLNASPFHNLTRDGNVTDSVLEDFSRAQGHRIEGRPEIITLTVGGNDLLLGDEGDVIVARIAEICRRLAPYEARVILNTVYDPSDGNDALAEALGLSEDLRPRFETVNAGIRHLAAQHRFLLSDLEALFHGHGVNSADPWYVMVIEPNLAGATAIAKHWYELLSRL